MDFVSTTAYHHLWYKYLSHATSLYIYALAQYVGSNNNRSNRVLYTWRGASLIDENQHIYQFHIT